MPEDRSETPFDMGRFWDERAREDAFHFVDSRLAYRNPDVEAFWAGGEDTVAQFLSVLDIEVGREDTVVDIGCGLGRLSRALAARAGRVIGLDVSAEMVARARELNAGVANVEFAQGDGTTLRPLGDASVDGCFSHVVFQHIPDPAVTLGYVREMGRVLRPGGWAAFQVSNDPGVHRPPDSRLYRLRAALRREGAGKAQPEWVGSAVDLDELRMVAGGAGLEIERVLAAHTQYCLIGARRR